MICRSCGMDSRVPNVCEWCKRPVSGGGAAPVHQAPPLNMNQPMSGQPQIGAPTLNGIPQQGMPQQGMYSNAPPPNATITRTTLTGEVIEVQDVAPAFAGLPGSYPQPNAINMPGRVPDPMFGAGLPAAAYSATMMAAVYNRKQLRYGSSLEQCLAFCLPILLASILLVHSQPELTPWVGLADMFLFGMLLGATRVFPKFKDAGSDVIVVLVLLYIFGPFITMVLYGGGCIARGECNAGVFVLIGTNFAVKMLLLYSALASGPLTLSMVLMGLLGFINLITMIAALGGWLVSGYFCRLDIES